MKKLTAFQQETGWRYSITATNFRHMWGIAGSHQIQFLDALHRDHAEVEDLVRTNKAIELVTRSRLSFLEASPADEAAGQGDEGVVQIEASLPADGQ
ncbi:hypothetical protein ACWD42_42110, partial [Streptomyces sp. NPDC002550]